jgi:hypothetical protein
MNHDHIRTLFLGPDGHNSEYPLEWLWNNSYCGFQNTHFHDPKLWDKQSMESENIAQVDMYQYMNTDNGVYDVVKSIVDFGVGIVKNVSFRRWGFMTNT